MNDQDLRAVRRTRPAPIEGWAASAEGRAILDSVLTRARNETVAAGGARPRRRLVMVIGAAALVVGGVTGAGFAGVLPFVSSPATGTGGMCARTLSAESDLSTLPPGIEFDPTDPAAACAAHWDEMWADGTPRPDRFTTCFHPPGHGGGGGAIVYPADGHRDGAAACAAIGAKQIPD